MTTECTTERLEFERFQRQRVVGRFDGGELGSDGGGLLLRELAQRTGLFRPAERLFPGLPRARSGRGIRWRCWWRRACWAWRWATRI